LLSVLTALAGIVFFVRWAGESRRLKESALYTWSLRLGALFFVAILATEIMGEDPLALFLFVSFMDSLATVLVFLLFMYLIHGAVEWLFRSSPLRRAAVFKENTDDTIDRVSHFFDTAVVLLVLLPALLMIWGVFDRLGEATTGVLTFGFTLGSFHITVGLLIVVAGILYGTYFVSWILQKMLIDVTLSKRKVAMGVRLSIARLVHYVISVAGFLLALSVLGFEISKITIFLSALGVGIGFGLQGIVNNFVCGLILLFERPVRVGDIVEIGGRWAKISRIGTRATTVHTYDEADVIVPNADLISSQVTNWTLNSRRARLIIPVGVAYGSDVEQVVELLRACARENPNIAKAPAPQVLFLSFGASSLDFELRAVVPDAESRLGVRSELHQEIDRRFREAGVEIAFPQHVVHLHSMDATSKAFSPEKADEGKELKEE
jgi:small-conductance mechanosensitive channel